jgi:hypothetical protein
LALRESALFHRSVWVLFSQNLYFSFVSCEGKLTYLLQARKASVYHHNFKIYF